MVVTLVDYHLADDIAVFRQVSATHKGSEPYRFVTPSELGILPANPDPRGIPAFLVAYCASDSPLMEDFIKARETEDLNLHRLIMSQCPYPPTRYTYMLANYLAITRGVDSETHTQV